MNIDEKVVNTQSCGNGHKVTADHPILKRPDKKFRGVESFNEALEYATELQHLGYENILISECHKEMEES